MRSIPHRLLVTVIFLAWSEGILAQEITNQALQQDTTKKETPSSVPPGNAQMSAPKSYNSLIRSSSLTRKGLFTVHKIEDNYFFEVPDTLLGRDLLVVCRIAQGAAGMLREYTGYAGDKIGNTVIRFEKGPGHKLFLRRITYEENPGDSTNAMYRAVVRSNLQPLVAAFGISAYNPGKSSVIDVTDYINGDNEVFFFNSSTRKAMKVGSPLFNMCYIKDVNSYPLNLEIRTIKTYKEATSDNNFTLELNTSIVLLPKRPMRKRFADPRVGYFSEHYTDFASNPRGIKVVNYIKRWRLEPRPEDVEKYLMGELVEPVKPIIYYIDPATPQQWVPYLIQGIKDWQEAFEQAGFKNAIQAVRAPIRGQEETWSLEDSRHSAIVYKPSSMANAAGPIITDPRSGEILETHINWYHNLMSILQEWYMIQCGPNDPGAQKMEFENDLMGQIIRSVASHEVGHTLGLTHNFGASASVPVEKLRDRKWLDRYGLSPSIMDYARFNYVAQPGDSVGERGLIGRIGDYDRWAIEWGYRWFPESLQGDRENAMLSKRIAALSGNPRLRYGSELSTDDPRNQTEDVGDNNMKADEYGMRNLQRVVPNLIQWTYEENEDYSNLSRIYQAVVDQYGNYLNHALAYIGSVYENKKTFGQPGVVYEPVPVNLQLSAIDFLTRHALATPRWLLDSTVMACTGQSPLQIVRNSQEMVLNTLFSAHTLTKLSNAEAAYGPLAYHTVDFFDDIDRTMWTELRNYDAIEIYRRNLQRAYIDKLIELANPAPRSERAYRDVAPIVIQKLAEIRNRIQRAVNKIKDPMTVYHLRFLQDTIDEQLKNTSR